MPDVYATITEAERATLEKLAEVIELRAADSLQRSMLEDYAARIDLAEGSRVLEIGCATGAISRYLVTLPGVAEMVGVDPGDLFIERARELADDRRLRFAVGDGRDLRFDDGSFDAVVCHTVLCHVPGCEQVLAEARRVLRPGGRLAIFDGDYATTTVASSEDDPLQSCIDAAIEGLVHDPWLMRRIVALLGAAGFQALQLRGHSYIQTTEADYMLTLVDRGADLLAAEGLGEAAAEALKAEARDRVAAGTFFGHIGYVSVIARRA